MLTRNDIVTCKFWAPAPWEGS